MQHAHGLQEKGLGWGLAHLVRRVNALNGALALKLRHSTIRRHGGPDCRSGGVDRELLGGGEGAVLCRKRVGLRDRWHWADRALPEQAVHIGLVKRKRLDQDVVEVHLP
eukprot:scaffold28107_cov63-Phaeocystis_antarctica.AAC.2